jgi:feruloyl esterase
MTRGCGFPAPTGSEHNLALAAKAIIQAYYKTAPTCSHFDGCSDGGRESLVEAERYPHDFNGILAFTERA